MKNNVNFMPGVFSGYQKYEGIAGLSKKWLWSLYKRHNTIHYKTGPTLKFQKYTM